MNSPAKLATTLLVGIALGAVAMHGLHAQSKPKAYAIAELEVTDPAAFKNYADGTGVLVPQAGGRFTATGGRTFVIGGMSPKRIAIVEWDSFEQAQAFYNSDGYKKLVSDRDKGSNFRAFVVEGLQK
jgi:uncharacterized protein (DUF1330 family)